MGSGPCRAGRESQPRPGRLEVAFVETRRTGGWTRRRFLGRLAAVGTAALVCPDILEYVSPRGARTARAMGRAAQVDIGYLRIGDAEPNPRPGVIELMLLELARNTSVDVAVEAVPVAAASRELFDHPMVFLFGARALPPLTGGERSNLERYLRNGGMLFVDDSSGLFSSPFDESVRRVVARLFPGERLERIPSTHVLYRTFFMLDRVAGRAAVKGYLEGITLGDGLTPLIYSRNDLAGAFARDPLGGYLYECVPGGESQRVAAYKLAINIMMYALCLNYKHDLTHVRALLDKRRGVFDE